MSDRNNNTDNQNTATTYIPPEARQQYRQTYQNRPPKQNPQNNTTQRPVQPRQSQPYQGQQYPNQLYQGQQYQNQPYQGQQYQNQPYQGQQYQNQPYQGQQYQNQPYQGQQYQNQPYQGQQYPNQPYQGQQYPNQPYQGQQYPNQPYQGQQYPNQPYQGQQYPNQPYPPKPPAPKKKTKKKVSSSTSRPKKKKKHKSILGKLLFRFLLIVFIIFLVIFGIYSCAVFNLIGKMDYEETGTRSRTNGTLSESYVKSVLIIGTDGRTATERGRSDTMMLMSLNSNTKTTNITSFMRDCYVEIPNHGWDKLNSAYSYGGAELLMDTIEHNFGVKVDDYVSVNFISFANIVDSVGGIDIDITDAEAQEINTILQAEVNSLMGDNVLADLLEKGGKLHLNGKQALSYSRIRYVGNADFERTERQRKVTELVLNKVKSFAPSAISNISASVLPNVTTNMTSNELYMLSLRVPFLTKYETKQFQIPADNTYYSADYDVGNVLVVDFDSNYNMIKQNIFAK